MIFFVAAILTLIAFPDPSRAVTFPITYSGLAHYSNKFIAYGTSTCETNANFEITLFEDGSLTAKGDEVTITNHYDEPSWCKLDQQERHIL